MASKRSLWKKSLQEQAVLGKKRDAPSTQNTSNGNQKVQNWLQNQQDGQESECPSVSVTDSYIHGIYEGIPGEAAAATSSGPAGPQDGRQSEKVEKAKGIAIESEAPTMAVNGPSVVQDGLEADMLARANEIGSGADASSSVLLKVVSAASPSLTSPANKVCVVGSVGGAALVMKKDVPHSHSVRRKLAFPSTSVGKPTAVVKTMVALSKSSQVATSKYSPSKISQRPGVKRKSLLTPEKFKLTEDLSSSQQYVIKKRNLLHGNAFAEKASDLTAAAAVARGAYPTTHTSTTHMRSMTALHAQKIRICVEEVDKPTKAVTVLKSLSSQETDTSGSVADGLIVSALSKLSVSPSLKTMTVPSPLPRTKKDKTPELRPLTKISADINVTPVPMPRARTNQTPEQSLVPPLPTPRPRKTVTTQRSPVPPLPTPRHSKLTQSTPPCKDGQPNDKHQSDNNYLTPKSKHFNAPADFMNIDEEGRMILPMEDIDPEIDRLISNSSDSFLSSPSSINSPSTIFFSHGMAIVPPTPPETPEVPINIPSEVDNSVTVDMPLLDLQDSLQDHDLRIPAGPEKATFRKREKRLSKQDQAQIALNKGLEHYNVKGKLIPARQMREECTQCRFKCSERLTEEQKRIIFSKYWALGNKQQQDGFIRECITIKEPTVHRSGDDIKHKNHTIKYSFKFPVIGQVFVCKTMFLNSLGISESPVRTQVKKLERGITLPSPDKRGRHAKISPELRMKNDNNIMEHIQLFKTVPSHFCRLRSKRKYLSASLTIRHMWRLYKTWMAKRHPNDKIKSEKFYRKIFCTRFNLGFHKPKKDRCDLCLVYEIGTPSQKKKLKAKYDEHIRNKKNAKAARMKDEVYAKSCKDTVCYCLMDLQQVISIPKTEAGMVFYKRKLSTYNFTVYDRIHKQGYCYVWNESEARRGANEIATCVLRFITKKASEGITEFIIWSDNCGGQNKNKYLFSVYTWATARLKVKITHRYMERGHTMNEADSMHATIERAARYVQIFEPNDLVPIIVNAKRKGKKYIVELVGSEILDCHPLADQLQNWTNRNAKWKQVREITVDNEHPGKVFLRHDLTTPTPQEIKITKVGRNTNLATYSFSKAFNGPLQLKLNKLKDLASLCNELVIPSNKHAFYKALLNFPRLDNPLLLESDNEQSEDDEVMEIAERDFLFDYDNDEERINYSDYEEELQIAKASKNDTQLSDKGDESESDVEEVNHEGEDNNTVSDASSVVYDDDDDDDSSSTS